jgi:hypothetical protein
MTARCHISEEDLLDFIRKHPGITCPRLKIAFGKKVLLARLTRLVKRGKLKRKNFDFGFGRTTIYFVEGEPDELSNNGRSRKG